MASAPQIEGCVDLERIGRGGFSVIYRARQVTLDRPVAVKVLLTDLTDPDDIRRFTNECQILGRLGTHRHVVDVYDARVSPDGQPYIIMKLYSRGSLSERVRREGPLPAREVAEIGVKLAAALQAAHFIGVIHRDIKPDNVLIDDDGEPLLTDFGVASVADATGEHTRSVAFSRAHAAPEVLTRNEFGVASDIYSLGSTLYTLLNGSNAFPSDTEAKQINAILNEAPPPLNRPDAPPALIRAIETAMSKDPSDRFGTAGAFGKALGSVLEVGGFGNPTAIPVSGRALGDTVLTPRPGRPTTSQTGPTITVTPPAQDSRRTLLLAVLAVAGVATVAGLAVVVTLMVRGAANAGPGAEASTGVSATPTVSAVPSERLEATGSPGQVDPTAAGESVDAPTTSAPSAPAADRTPAPSPPSEPSANPYGLLAAGTLWSGQLVSDPYGADNSRDELKASLYFTDVTNTGFVEATVEWRSPSGRSAGYKANGTVDGDRVLLEGYRWIHRSSDSYTMDSYDLTLVGPSLAGRYTGASYNPDDINKRGDAGTATFSFVQ